MEKTIIPAMACLTIAILLTAGCTQKDETDNKTVECNRVTGEGCDSDSESPCEDGFIFSQKDCDCVPDHAGCGELDKADCEQNENCFSFSRSGMCGCPACEIFLEHQCLPK